MTKKLRLEMLQQIAGIKIFERLYIRLGSRAV